jgi:hypothetical protein
MGLNFENGKQTKLLILIMLIPRFIRHLCLHEQGESFSEVTSTLDSIARGVGLIIVDLTESDCIAKLTVAKNLHISLLQGR